MIQLIMMMRAQSYLSVTRGNGTRLNSQVMIGGGCAVILQENLATEPCVTTSDVGWIVNDEIPAGKQNTPTLKINPPWISSRRKFFFCNCCPSSCSF